MTVDSRRLLQVAQTSWQLMVDLRRRIHRRPEVGLTNEHTQDAIVDALNVLDLDIRTGSSDTTWVTAEIRGAHDGPTTLLRADTDALPIHDDSGATFSSQTPGRMHACGHDVHTAMLVGAAHVLQTTREAWGGSVTLLFQPGEEGHFGAERCISEQAIDLARPTRAFGIHIDPKLPSGTIATRAGALLAGSDTFEILVTGKGGHASEPHLGRDPVPVACEIALALQVAVTRTVDPFDPGVVTVTRIEAGTSRNVMADTASLLGTARSVSLVTKRKLIELIHRVANGVAAVHGSSVEVSITAGYDPTINSADLVPGALTIARGLVGDPDVVELPHPRMGSEDFSAYLQHVPGVFFMLGVMPRWQKPENAAPLHSKDLMVDEAAMVVGAALHAALATQLGGV